MGKMRVNNFVILIFVAPVLLMASNHGRRNYNYHHHQLNNLTVHPSTMTMTVAPPRLFLETGENGAAMVRCRGPNVRRLFFYQCLNGTECETIRSTFGGIDGNWQTTFPDHLQKFGVNCPPLARRSTVCRETVADLGLVECDTNFGAPVNSYVTLGIDWKYRLLDPTSIGIRDNNNQTFIRTTLLRSEGSRETVLTGDTIYVNETIKVACRMSQLFSNILVTVRVKFLDGGASDIDVINTKGDDTSIIIKPGQIWFRNYLTDKIKINDEIVAIACTAQFLQTNQWIEDHFGIQPQKDGKSPKIEKSENTTPKKFPYGTENVDIFCNASGSPAPKISWLLNNDKMSLWTPSSMDVEGNLTMSILRVTKIDQKSVYTCVAQNIFGNDTMDFHLDVYSPSKPQILEKLRQPEAGDQRRLFLARQGGTGRPTCRASGAPTPQIRWLHNGQNFLEHMTTLNASRVESVLAWQIMDSEIEGNYTCIAQNEYGSDVLQFHVQFNEEPPRKIDRGGESRKLPKFVDILEKIRSAMMVQKEVSHNFFQKMIKSIQELEGFAN